MFSTVRMRKQTHAGLCYKGRGNLIFPKTVRGSGPAGIFHVYSNRGECLGIFISFRRRAGRGKYSRQTRCFPTVLENKAPLLQHSSKQRKPAKRTRLVSRDRAFFRMVKVAEHGRRIDGRKIISRATRGRPGAGNRDVARGDVSGQEMEI